MSDKLIYLDNSATTPLCPEAIDGINKAINCYANPSSLHAFGHSAQKMIDEARDNIKSALSVRSNSHSVIFTSGGSEANNLAIKGVALAKNYKNPKIIISNSEHPCVMNPCDELAQKGFDVYKLSTIGGKIDPDEFKREMTPNVILVSIMLVNNESGAIYNISEIFDIARQINPSVICHTDAVQAFLKLRFTVKSLSADMISVSSHKIHGPKGCGALIVSNKLISAKKIAPLISGGGQELNLRSGTENVIGIVGFGEAAKAQKSRLEDNLNKILSLRSRLLAGIPSDCIPNIPHNPAPHIVSLTLPNIKSETMVHFLSSKNICVSSGSACSSHGKHSSYSLKAFGLDERSADSTIRISLSAENTIDEIDFLIAALNEALASLVRISR